MCGTKTFTELFLTRKYYMMVDKLKVHNVKRNVITNGPKQVFLFPLRLNAKHRHFSCFIFYTLTKALFVITIIYMEANYNTVILILWKVPIIPENVFRSGNFIYLQFRSWFRPKHIIVQFLIDSSLAYTNKLLLNYKLEMY